MNAEFQRIVRRDKKVFLSDQCKETEENNRMGKNRDLLKKVRYTKGNFMQKNCILNFQQANRICKMKKTKIETKKIM